MLEQEDRARQAHLLRLVASLGVFVCATFCGAWLWIGSPLGALGPAIAGVACAAAVALVRGGRIHPVAVVALTVPMLVGLTISSWRFGALDAPTLVWLPFPLILAVLLGKARDGWVAAVATVACLVVLAIAPAVQEAPPELLDGMRLGNLVAVTVTALLLAASAESARRASTARIEIANLELAKARDAADAANRAKSEIMANVSHELRTPLHAVVGMADVLLASALDEKQREHVRTAREAAQSLSLLLSDLLDASRLDAHAVTIAPTPSDVAAAVRAVADLLRPRAEARGLQLRLALEEAPARLLCDVARLRQIVVNLLENAIKFTDHGVVTMRLGFEPRAEHVRVTLDVTDTGIGIAPDALPLIFERFRQADNSTTRRHRGAGLGLSIARDLATLMGGTLDARSVLGSGSTFTLALDLSRAADNTGCTLEGRRVLLADDNAVNQRVAALMLQSFGCEVDVAGDGNEAVKLAAERSYDVVLLDCHMPKMDGYRAAALIRAHAGASPPILALTAASEDELDRARAAGMMDVLRKPVDADSMRAALQRAISA
jgi:signal transduction histidine kinase